VKDDTDPTMLGNAILQLMSSVGCSVKEAADYLYGYKSWPGSQQHTEEQQLSLFSKNGEQEK
jgi:hypothetical protein